MSRSADEWDRVAAACRVDAVRHGDRKFPGDLYKIISLMAEEIADLKRQAARSITNHQGASQ